VQAQALRSSRPDIELALARQGAPGGDGVVHEWELGERPARGLREAIADFAPDLIHSHGPSAELAVCAIELAAGRVPVIYDIGGQNGGGEMEARALEESTAIVVSSQELLEKLNARHTLPPLTCVFADYAAARDAESEIGRIASLYDLLAREPMAGFAPGR
jgi:hypothetical protein